MALSKTWDNEIVNDFNSTRFNADSPFNEGCMCLYEKEYDGKVNRDVAIFAKQNGRKEGFMYNNRLYIMILNPQEKHKSQYEANRQWIIKNVQ